MKLKAEKAKALQEKTHLVQGEGSEDQYGFLEDRDMESIDKLGLLADVQIDRGPIQTLKRTPKSKCASSENQVEVIMCPNQHLSDKSEEVHHVHISTKRLKAESNTIVVGFSKMCLIGTDDDASTLLGGANVHTEDKRCRR